MTKYNPELVRPAEFAEATGVPQPGSPASIALGRFFSRAWFRRMWIIQELCVAREINGTMVQLLGTFCISGQASVQQQCGLRTVDMVSRQAR
jgi:hypothetical protein